jgi:phosphoglycolate phosphatase
MSISYRGLIFDLDGTLVDSYAALSESINHARHSLGYSPLGSDQIHSFVGDGVERLLCRAFATDEVPETARSLFEEHYDSICSEKSRLLEHVESTLEELAALGLMMSVCTNKPTHFSRKILDALGAGRHFAAVIGPDVAGARKPDRRHVESALAPLGLGAGDVLFVGDMPVDVSAARNAGIDVAVVATGSATAEALRDSNPDYFLETFSDLLHLVSSGRVATRWGSV